MQMLVDGGRVERLRGGGAGHAPETREKAARHPTDGMPPGRSRDTQGSGESRDLRKQGGKTGMPATSIAHRTRQ